MAGRKAQMVKSGRDMLEKGFESSSETQKSIGPESLHQTLCRRFPEEGLEGGPIQIPLR